MTRTTAFLIVFAGAQFLGGQVPPHARGGGSNTPPPDADQTPSTKPGTLDGVVTNSVTGEPVKKALITLRCTKGFAYQALSDGSGQFHFDKVDPGTYNIDANRDGFVGQQSGLRASYTVKPLTVAEEQHVQDVAVKLVPLATISGHVLDDGGEPIPHAGVRAMYYTYQQGRKQLRPRGFSTVNDLGEYELPDVPAGRYYLLVVPPNNTRIYPPRTRSTLLHEGYTQAYYPNATDIGQASTIETTPGAHVSNVDFRLRKTGVVHIRGKIVDASGQPARNIIVRYAPQADFGNGISSFASLQPDGKFDLGNLIAGTYTILATNQAENSALAVKATIQVSDHDEEAGTLALTPGPAVSGRITVDGAQPDRFAPQVFLRPLGPYGPGSHATPDSSGALEFQNVIPDTYYVDIFTGSPGLYVKSIRFGDQDLSTGQIDLSRQSAGPLNIVFGTDGGQLQGSVQSSNSDPVQGALVVLFPQGDFENRRDRLKQTRTDQNGAFQIKDVAPGEYKTFAWEEFDQNAIQNLEFRKAFDGRAASLTMGPNGKETVQLKLISSDDMEKERGKLP